MQVILFFKKERNIAREGEMEEEGGKGEKKGLGKFAVFGVPYI